MKTCHYSFSRKQIIVVWQDGDERNTSAYPRTERGQRSANAKLARLQADGYVYGEASKDWFSTLLDEVRSDDPHAERLARLRAAVAAAGRAVEGEG